MQKTITSGWYKRLLNSLELTQNEPESRFVQLATVNSAAKPENRTVVYRGFDQTGDCFQFITDKRSQKYTSIAANPYVELCWYFSALREQYRLSGEAKAVEHSEDVQHGWNQLSDSGKKQFLWGPPGTPLPEGTKIDGRELPVLAPADFCLIKVNITQVDYLNLLPVDSLLPQAREIWTKHKSGWQCQSVIP